MTLREIPLGQDGIAYVEHCLRQGTGLCTKVLDLVLADGEAFAPVPESTDLERAKAFKVGGLMSRLGGIRWLTEHVQSVWRPSSAGTLVFQDIWAKPTDPEVQESDLKKFFQASNVYYFCERAEVDAHCIPTTISALMSFLCVAFYSRFPIRNDHIAPDLMVEEGMIDELARGTQEVFVGAYDQEGLVMWRRS